MKSEELIEYKDKLSKLSLEEKKLRDIYLQKISEGEIYGPSTGYASIDKPWLQFYDEKIFDSVVPNMNAYEFMIKSNEANIENTALYYFGKKYTYRQLNKMILKVESSFNVLRMPSLRAFFTGLTSLRHCERERSNPVLKLVG